MSRSPDSNGCDALIIGAGIAGLTAARTLRAAEQTVLVLEKSRGLGGRAATRRWDGLAVDHGAQFFTARSTDFTEQVDDWLRREVCFEWARGLHRATESGPQQAEGDHFPRYACREGMAALGRDLSGPDPSFVQRETKAIKIQCRDANWEVSTEDGRIFLPGALVVTPPPPQSAALLESVAPEAASILLGLPMAPCLALVARYPRREFTWRGIQAPNDPVISWIGHDTSKRPELHPDTTVVVIHASAEFSAKNVEAGEELIVRQLLESAGRIAQADLSAPQSWILQRWRYALGPKADGDLARIFPGPPPLVLAGDAIAGGKIEGAWLSGRAAAQALLR